LLLYAACCNIHIKVYLATYIGSIAVKNIFVNSRIDLYNRSEEPNDFA
jgi:hypothetical protein